MELTYPFIDQTKISSFNSWAYIWEEDKFPNNPGVYMILDKDDNKLYIGETENIRIRMLQHYLGKKSSTLRLVKKYLYTVKFIELEGSNRLDRRILEFYLINKFEVKLNKEYAIHASKKKLKNIRNQYLEEYIHNTERTALEKSAIKEKIKPEEYLLWRRFLDWANFAHINGINVDKTDAIFGSDPTFVVGELWGKSNQRTIFLDEIRYAYNKADNNQVVEEAKEYARRGESKSNSRNLFRENNWNHTRFNKISLI
ncbi:TPA: GIY-YIG nuclease family protein [Bacillus cereus]|nr:GIY-YIG nuclease family protein [Bacillus cereus]HDR6755936.1 GIY-YIG nuclease family protein [Bacillus cereus]